MKLLSYKCLNMHTWIWIDRLTKKTYKPHGAPHSHRLTSISSNLTITIIYSDNFVSFMVTIQRKLLIIVVICCTWTVYVLTVYNFKLIIILNTFSVGLLGVMTLLFYYYLQYTSCLVSQRWQLFLSSSNVVFLYSLFKTVWRQDSRFFDRVERTVILLSHSLCCPMKIY